MAIQIWGVYPMRRQLPLTHAERVTDFENPGNAQMTITHKELIMEHHTSRIHEVFVMANGSGPATASAASPDT